MVTHVCLAHFYIEKQWKSITLEWKNVLCLPFCTFLLQADIFLLKKTVVTLFIVLLNQ